MAHGCDLPSYVNSLYDLFFCRTASPAELEDIAAGGWPGLAERGLVPFFLDSAERRSLVTKNYYFLPPAPPLSLPEMLYYTREHVHSQVLAVFITIECLVAQHACLAALRIFRSVSIYSYNYENLRMIYLASKTSYIDYIWILAKSSSADCKFIEANFVKGDPYANVKSAAKAPEVGCSDCCLANVCADDVFKNYDFYSDKEIINRVHAALLMAHVAQEQIREILEIFAIIYSGQAEEPKNVELPTILLVSGFGWSGSSAVYDYLRSAPDCTDVFAGRLFPVSHRDVEISIFWHSHNLFEVYKALHSPNLKKKLTLFVLYHILKLFIPTDLFGRIAQTSYSLIYPFTVDGSRMAGYLAAVKTLILNINYASRHGDSSGLYRHCIGIFLDALAKILHKHPARYLLLNNALHGSLSERLEIFPPGTIYLLAFRDPRDQYISWKSYLGCGDDYYFIHMREYLDKALNVFAKLHPTHRFLAVDYERFVESSKYREWLNAALGIGAFEHPYFIPLESAKRIGKYKNYPDQAVLAKVLKHYADLADKSILAKFSSAV